MFAAMPRLQPIDAAANPSEQPDEPHEPADSAGESDDAGPGDFANDTPELPDAAWLEGPEDPDDESLLLIVVGAELRAELVHRPLAYRLRERILRWQDRCEEEIPLLMPVVCSEVWYLNQVDLHGQPTISLGEPNLNAATAFLARHLPLAFVMEQVLQVHADIEYIDLRACLWGINQSATVSAVDLFCERYIENFLRGAHGLSTLIDG